MARITLGPLVSDISGKTAGTVFSKWKGRNYVRKLVTPANPQTVAQMAVRNSLARLVYCWRQFEDQVKDWLDVCASERRMSGYNLFMSLARDKEENSEPWTITPYNKLIAHADTFTAVVGTVAEGDIILAWTGGTVSAAHMAYVISREVIDPEGVGYDLWDEVVVMEDADTTLFSAGALTITCAKGATEYEMYLMNEETVASEFSMSMGASATSYAGA